MISRDKLKARTVKVDLVKDAELQIMFQLYCQYYENINFEIFKQDFFKKDKVILLQDAQGIIQGFSTLLMFSLNIKNRTHNFVYSGDTIINSSFWGTSALTIEFLKNIIREKIKHPFKPVWWYLISKGYKTYLLLANNFKVYYPRHDKETDKKSKQILDAVSKELYPKDYDKTLGLLVFSDVDHEKLKDFVAPINKQMLLKNKKINFFNKKNPNWKKGAELACIGKVEFKLALLHPLKVLLKLLRSKVSKVPYLRFRKTNDN